MSAAPPVADRPPGRVGHPEPTVEQRMARFIVWLARQDVPGPRRRRYHLHAERYLRWVADQPGPVADRTPSGYYTLVRGQGADDTELAVVRTALELLGLDQIPPGPGGTRRTW